MTELSAHGKKVKNWYDAGFWTKKMVYNVVGKNYITADEYEIITGEAYVPAN